MPVRSSVRGSCQNRGRLTRPAPRPPGLPSATRRHGHELGDRSELVPEPPAPPNAFHPERREKVAARKRRIDSSFRDVNEVGFQNLRRRGCARGSPAIQVRVSRFHDTIQQGPVQRQETPIVQSCKTLDDVLPGFGLPTSPWTNSRDNAINRGEAPPLASGDQRRFRARSLASAASSVMSAGHP